VIGIKIKALALSSRDISSTSLTYPTLQSKPATKVIIMTLASERSA
jgi:hypothetical protein